MIREILKVVADRQKSYADLKRNDIQYEIWEKVIEKVGTMAYRLALPPELEKIHNVFHVSMLRMYRSDPSHAVSLEIVELRPDLTYEEELVEILARD